MSPVLLIQSGTFVVVTRYRNGPQLATYNFDDEIAAAIIDGHSDRICSPVPQSLLPWNGR